MSIPGLEDLNEQQALLNRIFYSVVSLGEAFPFYGLSNDRYFRCAVVVQGAVRRAFGYRTNETGTTV